jgi:hypothetical protein
MLPPPIATGSKLLPPTLPPLLGIDFTLSSILDSYFQ